MLCARRPRITRHLHAASYLIPPVDKTGLAYCPITDASRERTRGRLAETGQFVLDVMGCPCVAPPFFLAGPPTSLIVRPFPAHRLPLLDTATEKEKHYVATRLSLGPESLSPPARGSFALAGSGEAWQASVRVRLLHAVARRRVALKLARSKADGEGVDDVALNQEDMIGTLASFAVAPLWCLERLGAASPVLTADGEGAGRRAYIRLWRSGLRLPRPSPSLELLLTLRALPAGQAHRLLPRRARGDPAVALLELPARRQPSRQPRRRHLPSVRPSRSGPVHQRRGSYRLPPLRRRR